MFDYTRATLDKTVRDVEKFVRIFSFVTQSLYIAYLIYTLICGNSSWIISTVLLAISLVYFVMFLVTEVSVSKIKLMNKLGKEEKKSLKKKQRLFRKIYQYTKNIILAGTLALSMYEIYLEPDSVHPFILLWTVAMVIVLIIKIILEITEYIVRSRISMFKEALVADIEFVTKPMDAIKSTWNKFTGKETDGGKPKEKTRTRVFLDGLVGNYRDRKKADKAEENTEKHESLTKKADSAVSFIGRLFSKKKKTDVPTKVTPDDIVIEDPNEFENV